MLSKESALTCEARKLMWNMLDQKGNLLIKHVDKETEWKTKYNHKTTIVNE